MHNASEVHTTAAVQTARDQFESRLRAALSLPAGAPLPARKRAFARAVRAAVPPAPARHHLGDGDRGGARGDTVAVGNEDQKVEHGMKESLKYNTIRKCIEMQ